MALEETKMGKLNRSKLIIQDLWRFLVYACLILLGVSMLQGQQLPYLRDVIFKCTVKQDGSGQIFTYHYKITNGTNSSGKIWTVEIDISRKASSVAYDTVGLRYGRNYIEESFRRAYPSLADRIVPVGFPVIHRRWIPAIANALTAVFFGTPLVSPGQALDSLILTSKALPALRRIVVEPHLSQEVWRAITPNLEDTSATALTLQQSDSIKESLRFRGLTVGPSAPPANFVALSFLDTLISYKHQAVSLGWLRDKRDEDCDDDEKLEEGIIRNLDKRLDKARRAIERGDSSKAKKELEKFVRKVEKIRRRGEQQMTSEAYALFKFNAEYLISKLPRRRGS